MIPALFFRLLRRRLSARQVSSFTPAPRPGSELAPLAAIALCCAAYLPPRYNSAPADHSLFSDLYPGRYLPRAAVRSANSLPLSRRNCHRLSPACAGALLGNDVCASLATSVIFYGSPCLSG